MTFPDAKRIIYNKNPLDTVICQVRFPPILKIETNVPSEFQDKIRSMFPLYNEKTEYRIDIPSGGNGEIIPELLKKMSKTTTSKNHEFSSDDGNWIINLGRTFIAITCKEYTRWEDFIDKFKGPFEALLEVYSPSVFNRVGLRYIDIINRHDLGLENIDWKLLIHPQVLGILSSPMGDKISNFQTSYELQLDDDGSIVRVSTSFAEHIESNEKCYVIDSDFYSSKKIMIDGVFSKLDFFHGQASNLIQWIILKKLHNAMEPKEI